MKTFFICPKSLNPKQTYREYPLGAGYLATSTMRDPSGGAGADAASEGKLTTSMNPARDARCASSGKVVIA